MKNIIRFHFLERVKLLFGAHAYMQDMDCVVSFSVLEGFEEIASLPFVECEPF